MKSDQEIDRALADEFSGYLRSISKEIVQPIREQMTMQKSETDRFIDSIGQAGSGIGSLLDIHHKQLTTEGQSLLAALDSICKEMSGVVGGISAANEITRARLVGEAASIAKAVNDGVTVAEGAAHDMREALSHSLAAFHTQTQPWISQAGKSIETAMKAKIYLAEARLHTSVKECIDAKFREIVEPLSKVSQLKYWLFAVCVLQIAMLAVILFRA